ncbi:MAG: amidohydrolase family protein [Clostridia bacterium]|nr:amidohydrolase family protein [Clostridia bacterium]
MTEILIKNGKVWDGKHFWFADVLTKNGKVNRIAESIDEKAEFMYDARGKIVSAGLVDAHVHMRGISCDKFGVHPELSTIPFGVTAAADAGGGKGDKEMLESFLLKNTVFVGVSFRENKACFDHTEQLLEKYGDKAIGVKVYFDTLISDIKDIKPLCEAVEYAQSKKLKVMVHSSNSPVPMSDLLECLRKGDILTHSYHGGKNNVLEDGFLCIENAKKRGVFIDAGLAGHVHTDFKIFKEAISNGALPDIISTDITRLSAYVRGGRYGMTLCMSIAKHLGMCEEDILRAVTSTPAKALGKEQEWGYLEVGRNADIVVLDHTNDGFDLTDKAGCRITCDKGYSCVLTIVNGEVVYKR